MLTKTILNTLALRRNLTVSLFKITEAIASKEPIVFWHSFNGIHYTGYRLDQTNSRDTSLALTCSELAGLLNAAPTKTLPGSKLTLPTLDCFFIEWSGKLYFSNEVWDHVTVMWVGEPVGERYELGLDSNLTEED